MALRNKTFSSAEQESASRWQACAFLAVSRWQLAPGSWLLVLAFSLYLSDLLESQRLKAFLGHEAVASSTQELIAIC
jgi:hypothetical protein